MHARGPDRLLRAAAITALAFGLLTIASGGLTLFGGDGYRQAAGEYVWFVLWFNFAAGFAYLLAGAGLWQNRGWAAPLAGLIATATALVFLAFGVHVLTGGPHEARTVGAMTLRTVVWTAIAVLAFRRRVRRGSNTSTR